LLEDGFNQPSFITNMNIRITKTLGAILLAGMSFQLGAAPTPAPPAPATITGPNFFIPIGGQNGTLDLYSDGRAPETSGFNVLGSQRMTVPGNSVSAGMLTLNLHFSGFALDPMFPVESARVQFTVRDLDFMPERITSGASLVETAALSAINGVPLATPMQLGGYLPEGTTRTGGQLLTLDPIHLSQSSLPMNFAEPFVLSFIFTATVTTRDARPVTIINSAEQITSGVTLTLSPDPVPEPSTLALLGIGTLWLAVAWRRRR